MKRLLAALIIGAAVTTPAAAQMNCGQAVTQLQSYAMQVNQAAQQYYQSIPMQCGPNQQCQYMLLNQLNGWYQQQSAMVNGWYMQINQQCNQRQGPTLQRRPGNTGAPPTLDARVDDLQVDDEDKTVRIRIPSTPQGYR